MRKLLVLFFLVISISFTVGQTKKVNLYINNGVDTLDQNISSVVKTWDEYLNSNPDSSYDNPYWLQSEIKKYKSFDLLNHSWFYPSLYNIMQYLKPSVLSVSEKKDYYVIRTLFAGTPESDSNAISTLAITEVAAVKHNGKIKLCNILPFNTAKWQREKVGSITFIFPKSHKFNRILAKRLSNFVDSLAAIWNLKTKPTEYYFADDFDVVAKALGLDYRMGEGNKVQPRGFTDVINGLVYAGGSNEWFPHEFVHIYINPLYPDANSYFLEGYATLMGGTGGKSFEWNINKVNNYLKKHPEMSALNYTGLNYFTGPEYTIGALLCKMALDKGGLNLLKKLMSYGKGENNLYKAIKDVFNIDKPNVDKFIRAKLDEYNLKK